MQPAEQKAHRFSIILMPDGSMRLEGIIDNKLIMYGALACAEKALDEYYAGKEAMIQRPTQNEKLHLARPS